MKSIIKLFIAALFLFAVVGCKKEKQVASFYPTTTNRTIKVHYNYKGDGIIVYSYKDNAIDTILKLYKKEGEYYGSVLDAFPELILSNKNMMDTTYVSSYAVPHRILIRKEGNSTYSSTIFSFTNNILIKLEYDDSYKIRKIKRFGLAIEYIRK